MDSSLTVMGWVEAVSRQLADADVYLGHGTDSYWDEAVVLVCHALDLPVENSADAGQQNVSGEDGKAIAQLVERRIVRRVPAAYLTGEAVFAGMSFEVNEDVLVPRSPIAELIEEQFQPWLRAPSPIICDLCTGSGCIGIAAAAHMPDATVVAVDLSEAALKVAHRNVQRHHLQDRVTLVQSDLFNGMTKQRFDLLVSNPPYVADQEWRELPSEYVNEPRMALHAGDDGLDLVLQILSQAPAWLARNGIIIMEVGSAQGALEALLPDLPLLWLDFERGGSGVFLLEACHLQPYQAKLAALVSARTS